MLFLHSIAYAVLALGPPASTPADAADLRADGAAPGPAEPPVDAAAPLPPPASAADGAAPAPAELPVDAAAPLRSGLDAPPPASAAWLPVHGHAPLQSGAMRRSQEPGSSAVSAPLRVHPSAPPPPRGLPMQGVAPLDEGPDAASDAGDGPAEATVVAPYGRWPSPTAERPDPRKLRVVRLELLVGPVWRVRTGEMMALGSVEAGRLRGFSGTVQGGIIVAPDRDFVAVADYPIGAGFVFRGRFGERPLHGSVGLTAGLLVHRAATERGVIYRVDPDLQVPLRFTWTVGEVGFSFALLQGFSVRARTYSRRGAEVWHRIPYRVGFAVGIHFDIGVGRTQSRRSTRGSRVP